MFDAVKTMEELKATFEIALANKRGVVVLVKLPGLEAPEEIRNPYSNVRTKLDYYIKTYSSDLIMKNNEEIKIVDCYVN